MPPQGKGFRVTRSADLEFVERQVEAFRAVRPQFEVLARVLVRELQAACAGAFPEAVVQARAKSLASFAEKCIRKRSKYNDPVHQFGDLCGARIIVQTQSQVDAVRAFVESRFEVLERDDKALRLGADAFGYRDMHFGIRFRDRIGFSVSDEEWKAVQGKRVELQVRTWVQHAWADTLHDRIYKAPLKLSSEVLRMGNLLAAILEQGDRGFEELAMRLDAMHSNYSGHATPSDAAREEHVLELLLETNRAPAGRAAVALRLARLRAAAGDWKAVVEFLAPDRDAPGLPGWEIRLELGYAQCRRHRHEPRSSPYREGQSLLESVALGDRQTVGHGIVPLHRLASVQARALARLAATHEWAGAAPESFHGLLAKAVELEPTNPYYLVGLLSHEWGLGRGHRGITALVPAMRGALRTCGEHAASGTEWPASLFAIGRLHLMLGEVHEALAAYCRAARFCRLREGVFAPETVADEVEWLGRVRGLHPNEDGWEWARKVLELACGDPTKGGMDVRHPGPRLIIAGGAASWSDDHSERVEEWLSLALSGFKGQVVSGGTVAGVSGCAGAAAERLAQAGSKGFVLVGYVPQRGTDGVARDPRYDQLVETDDDGFSPGQVVRAWHDMLEAGVSPADVTVLGFGGGPVSAFEYRMALAMGATVGLVDGLGGAAGDMLADPLWASIPELLPVPQDGRALMALVGRPADGLASEVVELMARDFHERYRQSNVHKVRPDTLRPWEALPETYRAASRAQAAHAVRMLEQLGLQVRAGNGLSVPFAGLAAEEIDRLAEMEHGRWVIERLRDGWRPGPRDDAHKRHDCLVPWAELKASRPDVADLNRLAVVAFPDILRRAGLVVLRGPADAT